GWEQWEALLNRYSVDAALLRRGQMQAVIYPSDSAGRSGKRGMRAFSAAHFQASRWALVYWDDQAPVFVRRDDPKARSVLDQEYRLVNPDDLSHLLYEIRRGKASRAEALAEVERRLSEDPSCRTAKQIRSELSAMEPSRTR